MNYQQILTGLCFVLVVLLIFDIHLRMNEPSMAQGLAKRTVFCGIFEEVNYTVPLPTPGKVQYIYPTNLENQPDAENPEIFKNNSPNYGHLPPQGLFDKYKRKILEIKPTEKPQKVRFRNFSKNQKTNF